MKMKWKQYSIASFIGMLPRCFILAFIGWQFNTAYIQIANRFEGIENLLTYLIILVVISYIIAKRFKIIDMLRRRFLE